MYTVLQLLLITYTQISNFSATAWTEANWNQWKIYALT